MNRQGARSIVPLVLIVAIPASSQYCSASLESGIASFQARRWSEAMADFLEVLQSDPSNAEAHAYVTLTTRQMEAERQGLLREHRLQILNEATSFARQRDENLEPLAQAFQETSSAAERAQKSKWLSACEEARLERQAGRLLSAADILLKVLSEEGSFPEAQRELSELQSQMRHALDGNAGMSIMERYAVEGFYAYGQADYAAALSAWTKLRTLITQSDAPAEAERHMKLLRVPAYETLARRHCDELKRLEDLKGLFDSGVHHFQQKRFPSALEEFRKIAIQEPGYPQLGYYLVQTEAALEKDRAARLGEKKRRAIESRLQEGLGALDHRLFAQAQEAFEDVLRLDPSHPGAHAYLAMATAERRRLHDPKAAQLHYEAGLIAYASGKLDEAMREWRITARMNPGHEKAKLALGKVQKEIALRREEEPRDEAFP